MHWRLLERESTGAFGTDGKSTVKRKGMPDGDGDGEGEGEGV
ncbi:MAG: hypothetical protein ACREL7_16840 [Longimicrobiales bacterium]